MWWLILQVIFFAAWYLVWPAAPVWLVFLPFITVVLVSAFAFVVTVIVALIAVIITWRNS